MARPVPVLLGDDDERARPGLIRAVQLGGGSLVGIAETGRLLLGFAQHLQPRLIVFDLVIAGSSGVSLVPELLAAAPRSILAVFDPLIVLRSLDLTRVRVIDKADPRQLRELVSELAGPISLEEDPARRLHPPR